MTVVAPTTTELLDGTVRQRFETFRFDLLDASGMPLGRQLAIDATRPPVITNDTSRDIFRTMMNVYIPPRGFSQSTDYYFADEIDPLTMQVAAYHVLSNGEDLPIGVFLWGDDNQLPATSATVRPGSFVDRGQWLLEPLSQAIGYSTGTSGTSILTALASLAGFTNVNIEASSTAIASPVGWPAGVTRYLDAMRGICAALGFLPPYLDGSGVLVCRSAPELSTATPDFTYGPGTTMIDGSIVVSGSPLLAANRYLAVNTNSAGVAIVGTYDIPSAAPNSFANLGRYKTKAVPVQGLESTAAAQAAAQAAYANDPDVYTSLSFETPPDGRHDTFNVVSYGGSNYRQQGFELTCMAGGRMRHWARGVLT